MIFLSSAIDRGFDPQSGQIKDNKIGMCCFSAKYVYAALRRKNKDWLARNQDNVSEWGGMSIRGLLFQWATCNTTKIQLSVLVYYKVDPIIISLIFNLFSSWFSRKNVELALNNNHSLILSAHLRAIWGICVNWKSKMATTGVIFLK